MGCELALPDIRLVHEELGFEEARRVKALDRAIRGFIDARDKAAFLAEVRPALEALGVRGVSLPSMYRKAALYVENGKNWRTLMDKRIARRLKGPGGLAGNGEFREWWSALALSNKRKTAPAYRRMIAMLRNGDRIPGVGDWRDLWAADHDGVRPPEGMPCPYHVGGLVPRGMSYRNMMALMPSDFAVTAARKGMMAAQMSYIPDVPRTRVGLAPCQVVQIDDMVHEVKVAWDGNHFAQRVMDLSMIDVLTSCTVGWLCFPMREDDEGRLKTVRGEWVRYLMAHLLCDVGIPESGLLVMGEHQTAKVDGALLKALNEAAPGKVRFSAGGVLSTPLGKGLYTGRPKGNPRFKALLEGKHSLIKNLLGDTRGHMGGGRGAEPEEVYGMEQADERLRRVAAKLEASRPGLLGRLSLPYMPWTDYWELARGAYEAADDRTWHSLEGWRECGFETGEWRPSPDSPWMPMASLKRMDPKAAVAFESLIAADPALFRMRRMSPREAFASRTGELRRLDGVAAMLVMGEGLARPCRCDDKLQLLYRDDSTMRRLTVAGVLDGGRTLERGKCYQVWHNPLNGGMAYVADESGRYLGTAPVMVAASYGDKEAVERNLGIRNRALGLEKKQVNPYVRKRQAEANEAARRNALEILGSDPAEDATLADAAAREVSGGPAADYVPPTDVGDGPVADIDAALAGVADDGHEEVDFAVLPR